jgi:hypothetical protein
MGLRVCARGGLPVYAHLIKSRVKPLGSCQALLVGEQRDPAMYKHFKISSMSSGNP